MSLQELRVLRRLLVVARWLGFFPFTIPSHQPTPATDQKAETESAAKMNNVRLFAGIRRSNTWTVWSLAVLIAYVVGGSIFFITPDLATHFNVSNTLSTAQSLTVRSSYLAGAVLMLYLLLNTFSLMKLTNALEEQYFVTSEFHGMIWYPHKDWIFMSYLLTVTISVLVPVGINVYYVYVIDNYGMAKANRNILPITSIATWILKDIVKSFVVSFLYATSQFLASLYSRVLTSLCREQKVRADHNHKDQDLGKLSYMVKNTDATDTPKQMSQVRRDATKRILALHDIQYLVNDYFSYSVILVLTQDLAMSTTIIFFITSENKVTMLRCMSYSCICESISTIILTCCATDPLQRQVCVYVLCVSCAECLILVCFI